MSYYVFPNLNILHISRSAFRMQHFQFGPPEKLCHRVGILQANVPTRLILLDLTAKDKVTTHRASTSLVPSPVSNLSQLIKT